MWSADYVDEDGDVPFSVDFFMIRTNDNKFTDIEGARVPLVNQDQVVKRMAVSTRYNCHNFTFMPDTGDNQDCEVENITAVVRNDLPARYDFLGDQWVSIIYDTPGAPTSVPTKAPTQGTEPPTVLPTLGNPTGHPTHFDATNSEFYGQGDEVIDYTDNDYFPVGCLLNENDLDNKEACVLEFTICQASTAAQMYEDCDVKIPYTDSYDVGIDAVVIEVWLEDTTEAEFCIDCLEHVLGEGFAPWGP